MATIDIYSKPGADAQFTSKASAATTEQQLSNRIDQVKADLEQAKISGADNAPDMSAYETKAGAAAAYLSKADAAKDYLTKTQAGADYATKAEVAPLATKAEVGQKTRVVITDNQDGTLKIEW